MLDELRELYQEVILDHGRNPRIHRHPEYANRHALIIGIDEYQDPGFPDLSYAVADARAVAKVLVEKYGAEVELQKGTSGAFEITVDGTLRFSKKELGRFPSDEEVVAVGTF